MANSQTVWTLTVSQLEVLCINIVITETKIYFVFQATAVGDCQVSYVVNLENSQQGKKDQVCKITKVINYEKCRQRPQFTQNTFYGRNCDGCQQVKMESNTLKMY